MGPNEQQLAGGSANRLGMDTSKASAALRKLIDLMDERIVAIETRVKKLESAKSK